ncbi:MAG: haloacid dehalogenase [Actinomycetota bacterium]|nr:haloacid dehalogenase [Actinomycetota bacterium]
METSALADALHVRLDAKTQARDQALQASRSAIRSCGNAIRALHRHELDNASALIAEARAFLGEAEAGLSEHPEILYAGFVHDAQKELAEALITFALVKGRGLPELDEVGVMPSAYLKGMAESVGELRRHLLDLMRRGELAHCEELLGAMDDIYYLLVSMDYPDGITMGLRRLTDVARSIIERTRGDFTTSSIQAGLRASLEQYGGRPAPGG